MQTLRSRRSPSKYKNEPTRFLGDGMTFKAKLIGILEVSEARGDKMCQDALNDLKTAIRAAGEHKQRITISIAIDGLRLRDEKTGDSMYHHPVHKISFIAQDMSDSRAFGYIFGSPDTGHRFFGIKTDKTASQVVIAMRDLFQVVFELKKKEIEMTKMHIELRQRHFGGDSANKEETDKIKPKAETERFKSSSSSREGATASASTSSAKPTSSTSATAGNSTAIADLLDLEDELNSIQQGISQMDRITPSDPFGPLTLKGDSFLDSFKEKSSEASKTSVLKLYSSTSKDLPESENSTNVFGSAASTNSRAVFFPPQTSPVPKKEQHWFDQETESLFSDAVNVPADTSTSPVTFHTPTGGEPEQSILDDRKSPSGKSDLFRDLDPLGTGKTKPYLDKKDFFQELKNPPKKVLKELISDPVKSETPSVPPDIDSHHVFSRTVSSTNLETTIVSSNVASVTTSFLDAFSKDSRYAKIDPFEDMDPFDKTDPFLEDSFPKSIGFPCLPTRNTSDGLQDRAGFRTERQSTRTPEEKWIGSPSKSNVFSSSIHGPLRVSLPPEKPDSNTTISLASLTSRFRSSPSPTEDSKVLKRKHYQTLKHSFEDKSDEHGDSPILEEVYVRTSPKPSTKSFDKKILIGSPPPARSDKVKAKMSSSLELLDATPDPPPRPKTTLFAIKPPPLPPKKQNQPNFRPPARPPSLEENFHYDYLRQKSESAHKDVPTEPHGSPKKTGGGAIKRQNSFDSVTNFPVLPKPPQRKSSIGSDRSDSVTTPTSVKTPSEKEPSVLNITLNQLDQSGMASLAASLGIPTENVCNMTLQELTKMLASKYLGSSESKVPKQEDSNFQADFDSNFSNNSQPEEEFDKYAVFKELFDIDSSKTVEVDRKTETSVSFEDNNVFETEIVSVQPADDGEDKYAALRQLSLSAQKSENLSDDLDVSNEDDSSCRADNFSDIVKQLDESPTPLNTQDSEPANESPFRKEPLDEIAEKFSDEGEIDDKEWVCEKPPAVEEIVAPEIIPDVIAPDEPEKSEDCNWATFHKDEEPPVPAQVPVSEKKLPNEPVDISPISSDGKDDCNPESFNWGKNTKGNYPWRDEDESWDDQSAKESYWSDESSHDGQSPLKENMPYQRKTWNKHVKPTKGPPEPGRNRPRRWVDDTEDEYEDMYRRRRGPVTERDRKRDMPYDGRWMREREWESDRRGRGGRRRSSNEFRRHCDSESDKEQRDVEENYDIPAGSKQKQYYGSNRDVADRHWAEPSRESRSKYKKPISHKRPSSASEAWRYDRYSNMDYPPRVPDKRESEDDDYLPRFRPSRKDLRYHSNIEHYGSYDRRVQATNQRRIQRGKRLKNAPGEDPRWSESRYCLPPETPRSAQSEDTPEATKELHFKFEDDFIPSPSSKEPPAPFKKALTERTVRDDWGRRVPRKSSSPATDNNNENFASFDDDFQVSPALPKDKAKDEGVFRKPSLKGRSKLGRQDSSTCLRKSESINIFSRESDPFEDDDFFSGSGNNGGDARGRFFAEKSRSNTNVSDPFGWKDMFGNSKFED